MKEVKDLEIEYAQALDYRSSWDTEWKKITDYLLPGRGIYQLYSKPQTRRFASPKVINTVGRESLRVLTSGFHGGLTSPSMPWFDIVFSNPQVIKIHPIKVWIDECKKALYTAFEQSNFYQMVHAFYTEFGGFGTAAMFCGEDSETPFHFELLTVGEYAFTLNNEGRVEKFFRTLFKTNKNLIDMFGDGVSDSVKRNYEKNPNDYVAVNHAVFPEENSGKPFTGVYWEAGETKELDAAGFYEFPFFVGRWDVIGSDVYGSGLGSEALPDIQRLQEMEKSFLMAAHKTIDPPLNAPARKKGKITTLPGGINYYQNPGEVVTPMLNFRYDFGGILEAIGRVEMRIRQMFFNDIFLTATRDPNASPLKATEVIERKEEKLLRLGPVIERVLHEFIAPTIERCFNIAARKNLLPALAPEYAEYLSDYTVNFISPLAKSQKMIASQPINTFLQFVTGAAQFNPEVLDKIDTDQLVDTYADVTGVPAIILRAQEDVIQLRETRAKIQRRQQEQQRELMNRQIQLDEQAKQADIAQKYSEVGMNMEEVGGVPVA